MEFSHYEELPAHLAEKVIKEAKGAARAAEQNGDASRASDRLGTRHGTESFDQFNAALLYCNKCGRAMPVRAASVAGIAGWRALRLHLPACNSSVGSKTEKAGTQCYDRQRSRDRRILKWQ